jgi:hypothetical protein
VVYNASRHVVHLEPQSQTSESFLHIIKTSKLSLCIVGMAQVTFTMPVDMPKVTAAATATQGSPFKLSWDLVFTFALLLFVCCCCCLFMNFISNSQTQTQTQCTPDAQPSTGTQGSDCCSTNGVDANGNCMPRSPMGVPAYGMQNSSTPQQYGFSPSPAPGPAAVPTPPVPYVSTGSTQPPNGFPPSIWNDNGNPSSGSPAPIQR